MTLGARVLGVIRRPRATFEAVVAAPSWLGLMTGMAAAAALSGALLLQSEVGRVALVDQWERTALAFGQQIDDTRYERLQALSEYGVVYSAATALLTGPALILGVAGLLLVTVGTGFDLPSVRRMLAVVTHASLILTLRQVVAAPIAYVQETTSSVTSLGAWFSLFDEPSPIARLLGALDLFVAWWVVVLAIGISVLYRRSPRRLVAMFVGAYVGIAFAMALAMAFLEGTA